VKSRLAPPLALLFIATCWGATFVIVKDTLAAITPEWLTFYRFILAGAILLPLAIRSRDWRRHTLRNALILGLLVFLGYWLQTRGLLYTTPSRSAFITGAGIVLVPFFDGIVYRSRILFTHIIGTIAAVAGLYVLLGGISGSPNFGDVLTGLCACAFALHIVLASRYSEESAASSLAAIQILAVGIMAIPTLPFSRAMPITSELVFVIVGLALINTSLAIYMMMWAQARTSATEAAIILSFEPVAAAMTSVALGGDTLTLSLILGGSLVVFGMILTQLRRT
jgi:drug/metabolite transporter (DMT)-like permease